ncbi:MAG: DUF2457 domain-containing protein [Lentisphaerae bacterium]|jgi:hypothetical protein|nr:DUF2457 domain-containing protein [Lentisphaerota bacterium]
MKKTITTILCITTLIVAGTPETANARRHRSSSAGAVLTGLAVGLGIGLISSARAEPVREVVYTYQSAPAVVAPPVPVYQTAQVAYPPVQVVQPNPGAVQVVGEPQPVGRTTTTTTVEEQVIADPENTTSITTTTTVVMNEVEEINYQQPAPPQVAPQQIVYTPPPPPPVVYQQPVVVQQPVVYSPPVVHETVVYNSSPSVIFDPFPSIVYVGGRRYYDRRPYYRTTSRGYRPPPARYRSPPPRRHPAPTVRPAAPRPSTHRGTHAGTGGGSTHRGTQPRSIGGLRKR